MQNTPKTCLQQNNIQKINQKIPFIYKTEPESGLRAKRREPQRRGMHLINEAHASSPCAGDAGLTQNTK